MHKSNSWEDLDFFLQMKNCDRNAAYRGQNELKNSQKKIEFIKIAVLKSRNELKKRMLVY